MSGAREPGTPEAAWEPSFWAHLDTLLESSRTVIDRPKGTSHPRYADLVYPLDYGYLEETSGSDGNEIDLWRGSQPSCGCDAVLCTVDLTKRDAEIKLLVGCTDHEKSTILAFHNGSESMSAILVNRAP